MYLLCTIFFIFCLFAYCAQACMNTKTIHNIHNIYMRQRVPILDPVCIHGLKTRLGTVSNIYYNEHNTAITEMDTNMDICVIEKMFYYMKQIKM